jgi:hypothetical protein
MTVTQVAQRARVVGVLAVAVAVVGLSFGSTIVKSSGSPGPVVAFWRLLIGSILWWGFLGFTRTKFSARDLRATAPLGILFGVNLCLFFTAARMTRVAPVILVPIAARRFREKLSPLVLVCGSVALCGVAFILLTSAKGSTNWTGNAFAVAAVLLWASYLIHSKSVRAVVDTKRFMAGMTVTAMLVALPFAISTHRMFDVSAKGWVPEGRSTRHHRPDATRPARPVHDVGPCVSARVGPTDSGGGDGRRVGRRGSDRRSFGDICRAGTARSGCRRRLTIYAASQRTITPSTAPESD